ncbi:MAG TPA: hypothetical protein IGS52_15115 [Oscillatoriaceae cyanobacterium M33_DOE_052]|uniref:Uncharacterized protein n=1 Tax=Planktothricoides sp. SpSt-374 TaxID=2282167 RepID=A0A7C3VW89_9CYAN|nr:hypothetical protein [Oscillatoriaceae cyanobacterium M33_DOE_052]
MISENHWPAVYAIAEQLSNQKTDVSELKKAISYLRAYGNGENGGAKFFQYLKTLTHNGKSIGHSQTTVEYYRSLEAACKEHLQPYQDDVPAMLQILGWAARIMGYYKSGGSTDFVQQPEVSSRTMEIAAVLSGKDLQIGGILDATITNIKGNMVTYTMLDSIPIPQKESKKANSLSVGQQVKVKILTMKNGRPIKVELIE